MIPYVVYSHTEFLDILLAQTKHIKSYDNAILLINKSDVDLSNLYLNYKQVLFYDDSLPYASRLLALSNLEYDYALFIHDIDIVINRDDSVIEHLLEKMIEYNIDRIDLQYQNINKTSNNDGILIDIMLKSTGDTILQIPVGWESKNDLRFFITKQDDVGHYIYNVNPSIWKISTLIEIMSKFKNETYRSIENPPTQEFCKKYRIYKLYGPHILCGGMGCLPFFQFIHISHGGKLLPFKNSNLDESLIDIYKSIVQKFSLDRERGFQDRNYEHYWKGPIRDQR